MCIQNRESSPPSSQQAPEVFENVNLLQIQLAEAVDENSFLKARLGAELKVKRALESKNAELSQNLAESKKVLQSTGAALMQVHHQTNEMKNKRDERELQLSNALGRNKELQLQVEQLEAQLEETQYGATPSQTMVDTYKKLLAEKVNMLNALEEQHGQTQAQLSQVRREVLTLKQTRDELQHDSEAKDRKITVMQKKIKILEDELRSVEDNLVGNLATTRAERDAALSAQNISVSSSFSQPISLSPMGAQAQGSLATASQESQHEISSSVKVLESKLSSYEGDRRTLEDRLAQLELLTKQQQQQQQQSKSALAPTKSTEKIEQSSKSIAAAKSSEKLATSSSRRSLVANGSNSSIGAKVSSSTSTSGTTAGAGAKKSTTRSSLIKTGAGASSSSKLRPSNSVTFKDPTPEASPEKLNESASASSSTNSSSKKAAATEQGKQSPSKKETTESTTSSGAGAGSGPDSMLTDVLFSSTSVVDVKTQPNSYLDKPDEDAATVASAASAGSKASKGGGSVSSPNPAAASDMESDDNNSLASGSRKSKKKRPAAGGTASSEANTGAASGGGGGTAVDDRSTVSVEQEWLSSNRGGSVPPDAAPRDSSLAAAHASESIPPPGKTSFTAASGPGETSGSRSGSAKGRRSSSKERDASTKTDTSSSTSNSAAAATGAAAATDATDGGDEGGEGGDGSQRTPSAPPRSRGSSRGRSPRGSNTGVGGVGGLRSSLRASRDSSRGGSAKTGERKTGSSKEGEGDEGAPVSADNLSARSEPPTPSAAGSEGHRLAIFILISSVDSHRYQKARIIILISECYKLTIIVFMYVCMYVCLRACELKQRGYWLHTHVKS